MTICHTVSIFNVYYLPEFIEFTTGEGIDVWFNSLFGPKYFNINILPVRIKDIITHRLKDYPETESIVNFMYSNTHDIHDLSDIDTTMLVINEQDAKRNQCFADVFPEFYRLVTDV